MSNSEDLFCDFNRSAPSITRGSFAGKRRRFGACGLFALFARRIVVMIGLLALAVSARADLLDTSAAAASLPPELITYHLTNAPALDGTWQKLWALTGSSGEVALMTWGDSVSTGKWAYTMPELQWLYGNRGSAMDAVGIISGVNATTDYSKWPSRIWNLTQSGEHVAMAGYQHSPGSYQGSYVPFLCNELTVFYISENGSGNFSVEASGNNGVSYSALPGWSNVSTGSGGNTVGAFRKAAIARGSYFFRIRWKSGTVRILGIRARDTTTGGIMNIQMGYNGFELSNMNAASAAVVSPIMAELSPDCEMFEMKDSGDFSVTFPVHFAAQRAAVPDLNFLLVGSNPVGPSHDNSYQILQNERLKSIATAYGLAYYDGYAAFSSADRLIDAGWLVDEVHPSLAAQQLVGVMLMDELGWDRLSPTQMRRWKLWGNNENFEFDGGGLDQGGAMRLIKNPNTWTGFEITDTDRRPLAVFQSLPSNAVNNPGAVLIGANNQGAILLNTQGRIAIGSYVDSATDLTGIALMLKNTGDLVMGGGSIVNGAIADPTSPANGSLWNQITQKSLKSRNSGVSQVLDGTIFTQTQDSTVSDFTESAHRLLGQGVTSLPSNFWVVGKTLTIESGGVYSTNSLIAPEFYLQGRLGGTSIGLARKTLAKGVSNRAWRVVANLTCRSVGPNGVIQATLSGWLDDGTAAGMNLGLSDVQQIDTTQSMTLSPFRIGCSAHIDNSFTMKSCIISVRN